MNTLTFSLTRAHVVLSRRGRDVLLVVHTTPHVGSGAFMRQLARNPTLRAPREEEAERRLVTRPDVALAVLQRHGLILNPHQHQQLQAFFGESGRAAL